MLIDNGAINADKLVLVHMPRQIPTVGKLLPNICYIEERHSLLKVPRVVIEFCMNGTITGDEIFNHFSALVFTKFDKLSRRNREMLLNVWPTGVSFLGSVDIGDHMSVFAANSESITNNGSGTLFKTKAFPFSIDTEEQQDKCLATILDSFETDYMKIPSLLPGFQTTGWKQYPDGDDLLEDEQLKDTLSLLDIFSKQYNIPHAASNYDYDIGRYLHRLCAFFQGFRLMGFNTYWCNYALDRGEVSLKRFVDLYNTVNNQLSEAQRTSPAWNIVAVYHDVAVYIMKLHIALFYKGLFGFGYIDMEEKKEQQPELYQGFLLGGMAAGNEFSKERVLKCAEAYHHFRDGFCRKDIVYPEHDLIKGLSLFAEHQYNIKMTDPVNDIDSLLDLWIKIINAKFPDFDKNVNTLLNKI